MINIKTTPVPGYHYKVNSGDWIYRIAMRAYGDGMKWPIIKDANLPMVRSSKIFGKLQEYFMPGDIVYIPELPERKKCVAPPPLSGKRKYDFTLIIGDREIPVESGRLLRTLDMGADGWTATFEWQPGRDNGIDKLTAPYAYTQAWAYIGVSLQVTGRLYCIRHTLSERGSIKELEGFSSTVDLIDSNVQAPYEYNKITLPQLACDLIRPHSISVTMDEGISCDEIISRVTADRNSKIFEFLQNIARQKGVLLSNTPDGDLLLTRAKTDGMSVGTISEAHPRAQSYTAYYDGRQRFAYYQVYSETPNGKATAHAQDKKIPGARYLCGSADESTNGNIQHAADWMRSKAIADALTISFPVTDWYTPSGSLWAPNTLVSVISPTIGATDGFTFLIKAVEFYYEKEGNTAVLQLVPPQVYTKNEVNEPW